MRPTPDPSTYGINKIKAAQYAGNYTHSAAMQINDDREEVEQSRGGHTIRNAVLGATGIGAVGTAIAAGLSKSSQKKIASVEKKATKSITNTDKKAMQKISSIYRENGIDMQDVVPRETNLGALSVPLSVIGASAAAAKSDMAHEDVTRVAAIEVDAKEEIKGIEQKVGNQIEALCDKEGVTFERPSVANITQSGAFGRSAQPVAKAVTGASRDGLNGAATAVTGVAAVAVGAGGVAIATGLSKFGQKKAESAQKKSAKKIADVDKKAMKEISAIYRERGLTMHDSDPKETKVGVLTVPVAVLGASATATTANLNADGIRRVATIEVAAKEEIKSIDEKVGAEIEAIHNKEGLSFENPSFPTVTRSAAAIPSSIVSSANNKISGAAIAGSTATIGLAGAAVAAGFSKSGQKKVAAVEKKSAKQIATIDKRATKDISTVYRKNFVKMTPLEAKETQLGSMTVPISVIGASAAASAADVDPNIVAKIEQIENEAKAGIREVDGKATEELRDICNKEETSTDRQVAGPFVSSTTSATSPTGGVGKAAVAAVGAAAVGAAGFFSMGGSKKSSEQQSAAVQDRAAEEIAAVDGMAMDKVEAIYHENGLEMPTPEGKSVNVGIATAALGIVGAGAVARKTKMGSLDLGRIAKAEKDAADEIKSIDEKAADAIAAIHEKDGKWFARPGASRAAAAAAAAGLGLKSVKRIAFIEDEATSQMSAIDSEAAADVKAAGDVHASHMFKCAKKSMTLQSWDDEEDAAATKYAIIEEQAVQEIADIDEKTEDNIQAIYREEGQMMANKENQRAYFTARGADGATATSAAITNAVRMANQRRDRLSNKMDRRDGPDGTVLGMAHLALYDFGATVASAGTTLTGADMEGPPEYDARATWTPEQRASRSCCA